MSMFNDISCHRKGIKEECLANARVVKVFAKKLVFDNGHLLDQVLKRSGILQRIVHKELGIISRTKCCWNSQKENILFSVQRLHCPGVRSKAKDMGQLSIHFTADYPTIETIFRFIISANQLGIYGAVANTCEEFEAHQGRSGVNLMY